MNHEDQIPLSFKRGTPKQCAQAEKMATTRIGRERLPEAQQDDLYDEAWAEAVEDILCGLADDARQRMKDDQMMRMNDRIEKATRSDYE
jgi:hypothetical protein